MNTLVVLSCLSDEASHFYLFFYFLIYSYILHDCRYLHRYLLLLFCIILLL